MKTFVTKNSLKGANFHMFSNANKARHGREQGIGALLAGKTTAFSTLLWQKGGLIWYKKLRKLHLVS